MVPGYEAAVDCGRLEKASLIALSDPVCIKVAVCF